MIYSLGGFKFEGNVIVGSFSRVTNYGINAQDRINAHNALISLSKEDETISINAVTLPLQGAKNSALDKLYRLAKEHKSYLFVSGLGKILGKFVITSITEGQSRYTTDGLFLQQDFTLSLRRDYD
jgi:phage protein U